MSALPHRFAAGSAAYLVRVARPDDADALRRMLEAARPDDIRLRFFRYVRTFPQALTEPLTRDDGSRHFALVAQPSGRPDEIVASAMLVADPDGRGAEFGLFVAEAHRNRRLGTHLLACLFDAAGAHGIATVRGMILADNAAMIDLARRYGFDVRPDEHEPDCVAAAKDTAAQIAIQT